MILFLVSVRRDLYLLINFFLFYSPRFPKTAEIVELSGQKASEENERNITIDHLQQAIHLDGELASLFDEKMERSLGIGIKGSE